MTSEIATNGPFTFTVAVGTAVSKHQLVKLVGDNVAAADAADTCIGVCQTNMPAAAEDRVRGNAVSVVPINYPGMLRFISAGAVTKGAILNMANGGTVDDTGSKEIGYVCITNGITAAGHVLEAVPII